MHICPSFPYECNSIFYPNTLDWIMHQLNSSTSGKCQAYWRTYLIIRRNSSQLKKVLDTKIPKWREEIMNFRKKYGKEKVANVAVNHIYGGMRGIPSLICETSEVDPNTGIRFRSLSIPDCRKLLPRAKGGEEPLPESVFWLLMTGDVPTEAQVRSLSKSLAERASLPPSIIKMLKNFPKNVHPMSQLSSVLTAMNTDSKFKKAYQKGIKKTEYWEYILEDALELIAKLPAIAATIYTNTFKDGKPIPPPTSSLDWSANFTKMLGYDNHDFTELMRLYLSIHSDHEGGNVSAHTAHLVGSALSDPYLAFASGLNGLAGPLHGLANQEVLSWLENMRREIGEKYTEEKLKNFILKTLKSGKVIPGYGHAVLRKTDPRFTCQREFALKHLPNDPLFKLVSDVYKIVPPILMELGKVQNPWPNVDAHSGILLVYYGMKEMEFYTVLFGVSRALGIMSSLVYSRAMGLPIERPKSFTTRQLMKLVGAKK